MRGLRDEVRPVNSSSRLAVPGPIDARLFSARYLIWLGEDIGEQATETKESRKTVELGAISRSHLADDLSQVTTTLVASFCSPRKLRCRRVRPRRYGEWHSLEDLEQCGATQFSGHQFTRVDIDLECLGHIE